jgi:1-acyl-sn-glycerol-3-phosphate acyltransferase
VINGQENVPETGPVIFAANHLNALMDPLAVISVIPKKMPIVYMVRSDYFKNKKMAGILRFCKLLPAFRMRDGMGNLEKNHGVFENCIEVLDHNKALGIMPEGNQGGYRKIRPLAKGIFRIAFAAQQKYGMQPGVKIVPVGINYENLEKFGKRIIVNIGNPIEVSEYMAGYAENHAIATNVIRDRLSEDLAGLTLNIDTEKYYSGIETASEVASRTVAKKLRMPDKTLSHFFASQKIAQHLLILEKKAPELIDKLDRYCSEYRINMKKLNLDSSVLELRRHKIRNLALSTLLLVVTFPVFIIGLLLNFFPFFGPEFIRRIFKINLPGGLSSLRFGLGLFTFPVFYILQGILICRRFEQSLWNLFVFIPAQYVFGKLSYIWYRSYKKLITKIRYRRLVKQNSQTLLKTKYLHEQICDIVQAT